MRKTGPAHIFAVLVAVMMIAVSCSSSSRPSPPRGGQMPPSKDGKMQKAGNIGSLISKMLKLMEENRKNGLDVSYAMELDRKSRTAMESGEREKAQDYIEEAISVLEMHRKEYLERNNEANISASVADYPESSPQRPVRVKQNGAPSPGMMGQKPGGGGGKGGGIMESAFKLQRLIKQARQNDRDVSQAEELDKKSRDAAMSGDREGAKRYLEQGIALLEGAVSQSPSPSSPSPSQVSPPVELEKHESAYSRESATPFIGSSGEHSDTPFGIFGP